MSRASGSKVRITRRSRGDHPGLSLESGIPPTTGRPVTPKRVRGSDIRR